MSTENNRLRALRYRKLALAETDKDRAALLNQIAEDADRGVLVTSDGIRYSSVTQDVRVRVT